MRNIFDFADNIFRSARASRRARLKYENILNDPEKKAKVVGYGISGIIMPIITVIVIGLCYLGVQALMEAIDDQSARALVYWVPIIILILLAPIASLTLTIGGLRNSIWQTKLDKKTTGIIGIIINSIMLLAVIAGTVIILASLSSFGQ